MTNRTYGQRRFWCRLALFLGVAAGIAWLSITPDTAQVDSYWSASDKVKHAVAYAVLTLTGGRFLVLLTSRPAVGWAWALAGSLVFGAVMEGCQAVAGTGRFSEFGDFVANAVGASLVFAAALPGALRRGM